MLEESAPACKKWHWVRMDVRIGTAIAQQPLSVPVNDGRDPRGNQLNSNSSSRADTRRGFSGFRVIIIGTLRTGPVGHAHLRIEMLADRADRLHVIRADRTEIRTDARIIRGPGPESIGRCRGSLPGIALARQG